ncbi:chromosome partitioning protein ParB [Akkermansia muciniphila]|nr:chromosome partitioning protein ParB [Akkermansia muciniphila]PNC40109.1 chromosome partitioning protein ParB [Akkermansia muciniphila]
MKIDIPCLNVQMVDREELQANDYNPNTVPRDKMLLLKQSILDNGFCFPIVTIWSEEDEKYIIVDGFHRFTICQPEWLNIKKVPIVVLKHDLSQRMTATVQFNKARGVHAVDKDADIVKALLEQGKKEEEIANSLGLDLDTVLRYKQMTGILALFEGVNYSHSWDIKDGEDAQ